MNREVDVGIRVLAKVKEKNQQHVIDVVFWLCFEIALSKHFIYLAFLECSAEYTAKRQYFIKIALHIFGLTGKACGSVVGGRASMHSKQPQWNVIYHTAI